MRPGEAKREAQLQGQSAGMGKEGMSFKTWWTEAVWLRCGKGLPNNNSNQYTMFCDVNKGSLMTMIMN